MLKNPVLRRLVVLLAMLIGLAVAIASVAPINRVTLGTRPAHGATAAEILRADQLHLAAHIALFSALGAVAWFASGALARSKENEYSARLICFLLVLLLGYGTEYLQHAAGSHPVELNDVVTNLGSSASVFALLALLYRFRKSRVKLPLEATSMQPGDRSFRAPT
jgi:hypothetical protein